MAEESVVTVADRTIRSMRRLATEEFSLFKGVTGEVSRLQHALTAVQDLRGDEKEFQRLQRYEVRSFLGRLEHALHRADNLLAEMSKEGWRRLEMSAPKKVLTFFSSSNPLHVTNKKFHEIKKVREEVDEVVTELLKYKTSSSSNEKDVVGRNIDKTEIIKLIFDDQPQINKDERNVTVIIPIVGDRGIGKTTLARIVYNDDHIQRNFQLRLWAFIGGDSDTRKVLLRLLRGAGVSVDNCFNLEIDQLKKELRRAIDSKKYFIVLDGMVDDDDDSRELINMFRGCGKGSRVLVTTRSKEFIARIQEQKNSTREPTGCEKAYRVLTVITRSKEPKNFTRPYSLNRLNEEDSWVLFKRQALMDSKKQQVQEFEDLGRVIAAKCEGVPLKLHAISTILSSESDICTWWLFNFEDNNFDRVIPRVANQEWRRTHFFVPQETVVGREEDKEAIMVKLMEEEESSEESSEESAIMVIPIVGIARSGKTTLAQLIFNDKKVECDFDLKIWVCVTDVSDVEVLTKTIALSMTRNNYPKDLGFDQLLILLRREIGKKRYLLVLDDMWINDEKKWKELIKGLSSAGAKGSRIIITTCCKRVAEITGKRHQHELQKLDDDKSWSLFSKVAFVQGEHAANPEVIRIGKEIVRKCGGIPLVLRTVGSILFSKNSETEWKSFYENEVSKISESDDVDVLATLQLSYDHLPATLKDCFAYCELFPKNYEIDVDTLITLWMSSALIEPKWSYYFKGYDQEAEDLVELGYCYFMELLRRSFFVETRKDELGRITKCKMHSLMHDLARKVAGNDYARLHVNWNELDGLLRKLDSSWHIPISIDESIKIKGFVLPKQFRWAVEGISSESICDVILKFKSFRMLDLQRSGINSLPKSIGELKQLCYLDLSHNANIKTLPKSISRLRNLLTLKLNHCTNLQTLPVSITKLAKLRNLENESCDSLTCMPSGLSKLLNLQTLSDFVLSKKTTSGSVSKLSGKLDELRRLDDLKGKLKVKNLRNPVDDKTAKAKLYRKKDLLSLNLIWDINNANKADYEKALEDLKPHENLRELSLSSYGGGKFSSWLLSHENLVKLSLWRCNGCATLPSLGHCFPNLQVLVLDELMNLVCILNEPTTLFSSLKELRLTNLPELRGWWNVKETTFSRLSKLVVENCPNLNSMPLFPCVEELLVLKNTSWEPFKQTVAGKTVPRTSSSSAASSTGFPLSKLRTLHVIAMPKYDATWPSLPTLHSVTLDHLADIKYHLQRLQQVKSLQQLHIRSCDDLKEIPIWINKSNSLNRISIKLCPQLKIPHENIRSLVAPSTSRRKVEIEHCPQVSPRIESLLKDPRDHV